MCHQVHPGIFRSIRGRTMEDGGRFEADWGTEGGAAAAGLHRLRGKI